MANRLFSYPVEGNNISKLEKKLKEWIEDPSKKIIRWQIITWINPYHGKNVLSLSWTFGSKLLIEYQEDKK